MKVVCITSRVCSFKIREEMFMQLVTREQCLSIHDFRYIYINISALQRFNCDSKINALIFINNYPACKMQPASSRIIYGVRTHKPIQVGADDYQAWRPKHILLINIRDTRC